MDKQRLLELAGVEGKVISEDLDGDRNSRISWDDALNAVAVNLVDGAHLDELFSGEAEAQEIAGELLDGRWIHQLGDKLIDELELRKQRAVGND